MKQTDVPLQERWHQPTLMERQTGFANYSSRCKIIANIIFILVSGHQHWNKAPSVMSVRSKMKHLYTQTHTQKWICTHTHTHWHRMARVLPCCWLMEISLRLTAQKPAWQVQAELSPIKTCAQKPNPKPRNKKTNKQKGSGQLYNSVKN